MEEIDKLIEELPDSCIFIVDEIEEMGNEKTMVGVYLDGFAPLVKCYTDKKDEDSINKIKLDCLNEFYEALHSNYFGSDLEGEDDNEKAIRKLKKHVYIPWMSVDDYEEAEEIVLKALGVTKEELSLDTMITMDDGSSVNFFNAIKSINVNYHSLNVEEFKSLGFVNTNFPGYGSTSYVKDNMELIWGEWGNCKLHLMKDDECIRSIWIGDGNMSNEKLKNPLLKAIKELEEYIKNT